MWSIEEWQTIISLMMMASVWRSFSVDQLSFRLNSSGKKRKFSAKMV